MKIIIIGDIHGKFKQYNKIVNNTKYPTIVAGIEGIGFNDKLDSEFKPNKKDKFFRGNHSDPAKCNKFKNYMSDYGYDEKTGIFHIAGADSIDKQWRTPMVDYWPDENISRNKWPEIIELYKKVKPNIVLTHTIPYSMIHLLFPHLEPIKDDTVMLLDELLEIHKPKFHGFGHFHETFKKEINGTTWMCIDELDTYLLETNDWK